MTTMGCGCCTSFATLRLLWSADLIGVLTLAHCGRLVRCSLGFFLGRPFLGFCLTASIKRACRICGTALAIGVMVTSTSVPLCTMLVPGSVPVPASILAAFVLEATFAPAAAAFPAMAVIDKPVKEIAVFPLALLALEEFSAVFCGATAGTQNMAINCKPINCLYCNTRILSTLKRKVGTVQGRAITVPRDLCLCWGLADGHAR